MYITDEGLKQVEHHADKKKDVSTMLMVQILREVRELKSLFKQTDDSSYGCDNSANSAYKSKD